MNLLRRFFTVVVAIFVTQSLSAQIEWSTPTVESLGDSRYRIHIAADLDEGWHIYDLVVRDGAPQATIFTFDGGANLSIVGDMQSSIDAVVKYDDIFAMDIGYYTEDVIFTQDIELLNGAESAELKINVEWMLCNDTSCTPPDEKEMTILIGESSGAAPLLDDEFSQPTHKSDSSLVWIIIEAMLWGFAALLTPCVFPMIPMTISFFIKGDKGRLGALLYGLFIVLLYTLPIAAIILITKIIGGDAVTADIFNWVATHWLPNLLFFAVFMLFAASFFGAFEITLPSSWINGSDRLADRGSIVGILFLALTLVLVSFSCTGPIVGTVLIKSTSGEFWQPIVTMIAFSTAFAIPFIAAALFPSMLQHIPKSGGWLSSVKVTLGFLELALGLKFLSVADQTYGWGVLDRDIYLAIWIVIFSLLGLYLLGKLRFTHDTKVEGIGFIRLLLSIVTLSFVAYMIPGMWGAPLKALSGYLPPLETQDFIVGGERQASSLESVSEIKYSDLINKPFPNGLAGFYDLEQAQEYALKVGKPLLVDLTGHGCVNCREMEQRVWSDPEVNRVLRDDYVIVALYMDDKSEVPEVDWVTTQSGRVLKSLGRINSRLALEHFGVNAQPYYIILGRDGTPLTEPRGYDLSIEGYMKFLEAGLTKYHGGYDIMPLMR